MSSNGFTRGYFSVGMRHGKCEACATNALCVSLDGAALISIQVCVRCLVDACVALLPELAREFSRWRYERERARRAK